MSIFKIKNKDKKIIRFIYRILDIKELPKEVIVVMDEIIGGFTSYMDDIPCVAQGDTLKEAVHNLTYLYGAYLKHKGKNNKLHQLRKRIKN